MAVLIVRSHSFRASGDLLLSNVILGILWLIDNAESAPPVSS